MKLIKLGVISFITLISISCNNTKVDDGNAVNTSKITENKVITNNTDSLLKGNIAYINVDSMLLNYKYYKELEKKLTDKYNRSEDEFNKKRSDLEKEVIAFKKKEASNGFLSQESYQMQGQELMRKEQELQQLNMTLSQDIEKHKLELDKQIQDTIYNFINNWNKTVGYDFILTKGAIIYANPGANITEEILTLLNERYDLQNSKEK